MPSLIERIRKDSQPKENNNESVKEAWNEDDLEYGPAVGQQLKTIQTIMKRLQFVMTVFGMHIPGPCEPLKDEGKKNVFYSKFVIYSLFVLLVLWTASINRVAFFIQGVKAIDRTTIMHLVSLIWHFHIALNATFMFKGSHPRFGNGKKACFIWSERVLPLFHDLKLSIGISSIKRQVLIVCIIGVACILFNSVLMGFLLFYPDSLFYDLLPDILISPLPVNAATKIITVITTVYMNVAWITPPIHCITLCTILQSSFKACAKSIELANQNTKDKNIFPECLYRQRIMHLHICKIVEVFDKDVKYLLANISVTSLFITCILVYQIVKTELDTLTIISYVFWLTFSLVSFGATCSYAASMNKAAHSPLDYLYETGMKGVTMAQLGQVNLFVAKLTAVPIGFSVLDFMVITKELILTVVGLVVTYSFVLLQF